MKLLWAGVIFGAGYVLGRPEGRAKLAELVARPEVAKLRQQAASTVVSAAKTGQQQLTKTAQKVKQTATEKRTGTTGDDSTVVTERVAARRGLRLSRSGVGEWARTRQSRPWLARSSRRPKWGLTRRPLLR